MVRRERGDWARVTPNDKRLVFDTMTDEEAKTAVETDPTSASVSA